MHRVPSAVTMLNSLQAVQMIVLIHLFTVIRQLLAPPTPPSPPRKQIGFHVRERSVTYRVQPKGATR